MRRNRRRVMWANGLAAVVVALFATIGRAQDAAQVERWTLVHSARVLATPGTAPPSEATIIVREDRIAAVKPGRIAEQDCGAPAGSRIDVIDLGDRFVLPGLIDSHTHLTSRYDRGIRIRAVEESDAHAAIRGVAAAKKTLEAGFTTVRDLGSTGASSFALRDAINAGLVPGPRILTAGQSITPTGGHSDETLGYREDLFAVPGAMQGVADGPDLCRQAVRSQVKRTADVIKLTATGGVLSNTAAGMEQQFFDDELVAIVSTAHLLGRKVAAHAHGAGGIKAALRAGVDSIEHGTFLDDEAIELFKKSGAWLVPTLTAGDAVTKSAEIPGYYTKPVAQKARTIGPAMKVAIARAVRSGVRVAFGTDAGVFDHGENGREFELLVEAGMSPEAAIVSATTSAAELLGLRAEIGTLEAGKAADIIAVEGDPLAAIGAIRRIRFVMHAGVVAFRP